MFSRILVIMVLSFFNAYSAEEMVYITIGSDAISALTENKIINKTIYGKNSVKILSVPKSKILEISHLMHEKFNRCGGFIYHPNLESAKKALNPEPVKIGKKIDYSIGQEDLVNDLMDKMENERIYNTIFKLSSYKSRFYRSDLGVDSQSWIKSKWESLIKNRRDSRVELFSHDFLQPSVILTIQGSEYPDEIIILGGHGDSINSSYREEPENIIAPGADDNASGIAVLTEILRVVVEANYRPKKTIKIISYAAEEVGLRGSNEIAGRMRETNSNIIGILQFDMTNFSGPEKTITLISDYTNQNQNNFIGKLIDKYVKIPWSFGRCGYACSDHASWTNSGYIASFPFEAPMRGHNPYIHTTEDTVDKSKNSATHALNFAKLGLSFLIELDK